MSDIPNDPAKKGMDVISGILNGTVKINPASLDQPNDPRIRNTNAHIRSLFGVEYDAIRTKYPKEPGEALMHSLITLEQLMNRSCGEFIILQRLLLDQDVVAMMAADGADANRELATVAAVSTDYALAVQKVFNTLYPTK